MASSSCWMPLFLKAAPHRTGTNLIAMVPLRRAATISSSDIACRREVLSEEVVVHLRDGFKHPVPVGRHLCRVPGRDLLDLKIGTECLVREDDGLLRNQVDDATELVLGAERQLNGHRNGTQPAADHLEHARKISARAIHLVYKTDARDPVLVRLTPDRFRLRLNTFDRAEKGHRAVQHAEAALDLRREIHVAGGIDDVDPEIAPEAGGRSGCDGYAALLLLFHPVHGGRSVVHLAHLVRDAGVIEDPLGSRRLTGIDVRHDPDVPGPFQRY